MDIKTLVDWASIASGIGTMAAAIFAASAIPLALRQLRASRVSAEESNTTQILLKYLESRSSITTLELFKTDKDGRVATSDFHKEAAELCIVYLSCAVNPLVKLVQNKEVDTSLYVNWARVLMEDCGGVYHYLISGAVGAAIQAKRWREKLTVDRRFRIQELIEEHGLKLTTMAVQIQKNPAFFSANESDFENIMGREALEVLVAFWVQSEMLTVSAAKQLSREVIQIRASLLSTFGSMLDSEDKVWDIEPWIRAVDNDEDQVSQSELPKHAARFGENEA